MCLGFCARVHLTEWFINNRNLLFTFLETGRSMGKVPLDSVSGEGTPPDSGRVLTWLTGMGKIPAHIDKMCLSLSC